MNTRLKKKKWYLLFVSLAFFIGLLIGVAQLMQQVRNGNTLLKDEAVLRSINSSSSPFWDQFYLLVTELGGFIFVTIVTAFLVAGLIYLRRNYLATFVFITIAGAAVINIALKTFVGRQRPSLWEQLILESSYSFPSGHAMASSILALCLALVLWPTKYRLAAIFGGIIYVGFVGYSRMYLGVHYPTDIIGGWMISSTWFVIVGAVLYGHSLRRRRLTKVLARTD